MDMSMIKIRSFSCIIEIKCDDYKTSRKFQKIVAREFGGNSAVSFGKDHRSDFPKAWDGIVGRLLRICQGVLVDILD